MSETHFQPIICVDFDGVIHSYKSGWHGAGIVSDPPVGGAIEWLTALLKEGKVKPVIYSSRSKDPAGISAMQKWFLEHGMEPEALDVLEFPTQKPPAYLTIDDRAICFTGEFPTTDEMVNFKPWNK